MIPHAQRPIIGCATFQREVSDRHNYPVGLMPSYIEAVRQAGGIPVLLPLLLDEKEMQAALARVDGVIIPGGGDVEPHRYNGIQHESLGGLDPRRDEFEINLVRCTVETEKPVLAICRGMQVFNIALGGTLWEDVFSMMPAAIKHDYYPNLPRNLLPHDVEVEPDSCLAYYLQSNRVKVNSLHHQGVRDLASGVRATAVAPDGLVEAIEVPGHPYAIGVQWHPECLVDDDPAMLRLFEGLVETAARQNQASF
jgi:putative glutamine amidotransferase